MRTATLREFRDRASTLLRGAAPVLVTRRGRIVGFFVPTSGTAVPLDIKRELFYAVTSAVRRMSGRGGSARRRSLPTSKRPERLVVDAKSALSGGAKRRPLERVGWLTSAPHPAQ